MRCSVWLEPEGELRLKLSEIIRDISNQFSTPIFSPHVSLISRFELEEEEAIRKTAELVAKLKPFKVKLTGELICFEDWSKALVIVIEKTPELMQANQLAKEVYNFYPEEEYMPHASLMYTKTVSVNREDRLKLAESLNNKALKGEFEVNCINLYSSDGKIEKWDLVKSFHLI